MKPCSSTRGCISLGCINYANIILLYVNVGHVTVRIRKNVFCHCKQIAVCVASAYIHTYIHTYMCVCVSDHGCLHALVCTVCMYAHTCMYNYNLCNCSKIQTQCSTYSFTCSCTNSRLSHALWYNNIHYIVMGVVLRYNSIHYMMYGRGLSALHNLQPWQQALHRNTVLLYQWVDRLEPGQQEAEQVASVSAVTSAALDSLISCDQ